MKRFFTEIIDVCRRHLKGLLIFLGAVIGVLVICFTFLAYKVTDSYFCDSCHYMEPYVRHWDSSSHAGIDCIDCHDYSAGSMAIAALKYWTNTYEMRPKADVPDENCLSSDCHTHETLDEAQKFRKGILFKHSVHLENELRGGKLHCTSCHNQIVQYSDDNQGHMAVNDKSCFVCHFKDAGVGEAITGCNSCHGIPKKEVEHAGFIFNHEPYLELQVECKQCHVQIVEGDGAVPESKCHDCHVERSRTELSEHDLHNIHVTINRLDCYKCHSDIRHGNFSMVGALDIQCENCHLRQHNKPKQLYMGIGGKSDIDMPSSMFTAQVSCTGCHTHITPEGEIMAEQEKREANRNSCVTCHGDNYDLMFDNWLSGSKKMLSEYRAYLNQARSDFNNAGGSKKIRIEIRLALSMAEDNYNFVREGHIPHNIQYSIFLLNKSADDFVAAMKKVNRNYKGPARGESLDINKNCTVFCHGDAFNPETVRYKGDELPHRLHYVDMELNCSDCHSVKEHGKTEIKQSVCADCH